MFDGKPVSEKLLRLIPPMGIVLVLGSEGSGKSVLGYSILESLKDSGRQIAVYGFPSQKAIYLPDWIRICSGLDFPEGAIVLADEAYLQWHSRGSMSNPNKFMDAFSGLVRQKNILAIYISQFSRKLDIGLVSSPRVLLIKQPSLLQRRLDRSELRPILADAAKAFKEIEMHPMPNGMELPKVREGLGADTVVSRRCLFATYAISNNFEGMIDMSNTAPTFWSEELSKAWKGVSLSDDRLPAFSVSTILCIECDRPAVGTCACHGNSYCEEHCTGHNMSGSFPMLKR
jgi:hypothetical protein